MSPPPPSAVRAYAPASLSNLTCGFDAVGLALTHPGDVVTARLRPEPGVELAAVEGPGGATIPTDPQRNTALVAVAALLAALPEPAPALHHQGLSLALIKGLPPGSGLGSSAASAAAAVVAVDRLLGLRRSREELFAAALEGEAVASGAVHGDNVAPALLGGLVLVRSVAAPDVVPLPVPRELRVAVLLPELQVATREARQLLPAAVPLPVAVAQAAHLGALVAALARRDWELLGRSLVDHLAEPVRRPLVPGFDAAVAAARRAGAVGAGLSGSGPAIFALCRGTGSARSAAAAMAQAFTAETGRAARSWVSPVGRGGARVLGGRAPRGL